jgi:hypothetical protein
MKPDNFNEYKYFSGERDVWHHSIRELSGFSLGVTILERETAVISPQKVLLNSVRFN